MATQASIEICFSIFYQEHSIVQLIEMLLDGGWTCYNEGKVSYLPIGYTSPYNWVTDENMSGDKLIEILQEKDYRKELIGVVLVWHNTNIGGTFVFQSNEKLFINLTLNRKTMQLDNIEITDSNWYFTRLLPIFYEKNIEVYNFSLTESF